MINATSTEAVIERFIVHDLLLGSTHTELDLNQPLISSGILDSLALLQLMSFIEQQFGVPVQDGEVIPDNFQTIKRISTFIERKHTN
jgi:acyl carrier protein